MSGEKGLAPAALLERVARALKTEIGPAVSEAFPKTQAFMASVVLQKLAKELRLSDEHAIRNRADTDKLVEDLDRILAEIGSVPDPLRQALEGLRRDPDSPALTRLVEVLHASREALGEKSFDILLRRVRVVLRARIDRAVEVAA